MTIGPSTPPTRNTTTRPRTTEDPFKKSIGGAWVDEKSFTSLANIVDRGNPALKLGSDLDRGLLKQGSEIVKIADGYLPDDGGMNRVGGVADKMFDAAGGDHRAVSDFITGHNMDATVTPGSKYDTDDHLLSVLNHQWDPNQHGAENLFKWTGGPEASDPDPLIRARARETADSLAHFLVRHEDTLALNLPGHGTDSLGKVNPGVTQALSEAMRPYLGNFVNAPGEMLINQSAQPFERVSDLTKLFNILDSGPDAAKTINSAGAQWNNYLAMSRR